jgi:hypothetical protein
LMAAAVVVSRGSTMVVLSIREGSCCVCADTSRSRMGSGGQLRPSRAEVEWDFKNDCINDRVAVMVVPSQNCGCGGSGRCTSAQLAVICASSVLVDRLLYLPCVSSW